MLDSEPGKGIGGQDHWGHRLLAPARHSPQKQESLRKQRDRYQGRKPPDLRRIREESELRSADGDRGQAKQASLTQHRGSKGHRLTRDQQTPSSGKGANRHVSLKYTWTDSQEAREAHHPLMGTDRQLPGRPPSTIRRGRQGE